MTPRDPCTQDENPMPQAVFDYEQLHRDRIAARDARLLAEQRQHELAALRHAHASLRLDLALLKLRRALNIKYRPDQPRVPAGNPDGGQWTDGAGPGVDLRKPESRPADDPREARITLAGGFTKDELNLTVQDFVSQNCVGSVNRKIPGEFYGSTIGKVIAEARLW